MVVCLGLLVTVIACAQATLITTVPFSPPVTFKQYSGFYDVGNSHFLHYWFIESESNPVSDPVIVWFTGGPGCSGMSALLTEWGPYTVQLDGKSLELNPYSWNKRASILTLESPAGVGYSYSTNGDVSTDDNQTAWESFAALKGFFTEFPQFRANDFYIAGESYAGIYVPTLAEVVLKQKSSFSINLKGLAIGNGYLNGDDDTDSLIQFSYNHGMVDETQWQKAKTECCGGSIDGCPFHSFDGWDFCSTFTEDVVENAWYSGVNPYDMYSDCEKYGGGSVRKVPSKRLALEYFIRTGKRLPDSRATGTLCLNEYPETIYMNLPEVRKALFIPSSLPKWEDCSDTVGYEYGRLYDDMTSRIKYAVDNGVRVLIYNGDVDMACNFLMGQRFSSKLGYTVTSSKRSFAVNGQVGGFHTQYENVEFVTVRGAGHMVPTDRPAVALHMINAFLAGNKP